jgi:hypothetical protein
VEHVEGAGEWRSDVLRRRGLELRLKQRLCVEGSGPGPVNVCVCVCMRERKHEHMDVLSVICTTRRGSKVNTGAVVTKKEAGTRPAPLEQRLASHC